MANSIPPVEDAEDIIRELKQRGYVVVNHVKTKIGADFMLSHELGFSKSIATGEVKIPSFFFNHPGPLQTYHVQDQYPAAYSFAL